MTTTHPAPLGLRARLGAWPRWAPAATLVWSLIAAGFSLYWSFGGAGFPFGTGDPTPDGSTFQGVRPGRAAPVFAAVSLLAVGLAYVASRRPHPVAKWPVVILGAVFAVVLLVLIPDARLLTLVGYLPVLVGVLIANAITGWWPDFADQSPLTDVAMVYALIGGVLWLATVVSYARRAREACARCGRAEGRVAGWTTPEAARRWGTWAVVVACVAPLPYPLIRLAWAAGIPLGVDEEFMREGAESKIFFAGAGLGLFALVGVILTMGLVQRWGEVYPRWIWWKKRKPVPMALAIVPATLVSILLAGGSVQTLVAFAAGRRHEPIDLASSPLLLFPVWGLALAAATLAYYYRRRGRCTTCGRERLRAACAR